MNDRRSDGFSPVLGSLKLPGMLYASTIRSSVSRAKNFKVVDAEMSPGYRRLFPADLVDGRIPSMKGGFPFFALSELSFTGQPLGLVVGPDPGICDELAAAVEVEYEEEEPLFEWESFSSSQIVCKRSRSYGDPEAVFASPSLRIERAVYRNDAFDHRYTEPMGALASWEYDKMAVYCASQWPAHVRSTVASCLGVAENDILVQQTEMGRAFDGRLWYPSFVACQAALAARAMGKPVRILYTREEDFLYTPKQARSSVSISSASDEEGRLHALDIRLIINVGAFNPLSEELIGQASAAMMGIYSCPSIHIEAYAIRSDIVPLGALGGMGATHAAFAIEAHINHLAAILNRTPAEIKRINMLAKGSSNFGEPPLDLEIPFGALHEKLEMISDYRRKFASYELVKKRDPGRNEGVVRGIALTLGCQTSRSFSPLPGMNLYSVEAVLERSLRLRISTSATPSSDHLRELWRTTASSILSIPAKNIDFQSDPPASTTFSGGPLTLSRGSSILNALVERSCLAIQKRRFRESLPITARSQTHLSSIESEGGSKRRKNTRFDAASWCGTAVELEIDPFTGKPLPLSVWMVVDAGRIQKPEIARSTLRSSVMSALRLCTGLAFDPEGESKFQYLRNVDPAFPGLPSISVEFVNSERNGQTKGLGELPFITVPAAFYSALTQAIGIEPRRIPLSGGEILRLMESS
ncbi:MAG: molybdopterin-dependent oxidoreductase [Spirochaetes bacterium]|nr:molybdopterin-dependent oxidoreductase [Spirochaetota bacterium]